MLRPATGIVVAAAQFLGAGHPVQWPLILAAATLMGFAAALPFGRLIPGGRALRMGVTGMLGFAGSILGLNLVTMPAFIAPAPIVAVSPARRGARPGDVALMRALANTR